MRRFINFSGEFLLFSIVVLFITMSIVSWKRNSYISKIEKTIDSIKVSQKLIDTLKIDSIVYPYQNSTYYNSVNTPMSYKFKFIKIPLINTLDTVIVICPKNTRIYTKNKKIITIKDSTDTLYFIWHSTR